MKVLQINTTYYNGGSTGRITYDLKSIGEECGIEMYVAYGYEYVPTYDMNTFKMESIAELKWNILKTRLFAHHGFYNVAQTKRLLGFIAKIKPDIIHLHNIHNHYVNVEMLFNYIKKHDIPVVWTLHDCWAFTGWCAYFDYIGCEKWKIHCRDCPSRRDYPYSWFIDRSYENFDDKRKCFCGVNKLILVTPSKWLAQLTRDSFLRDYPVKVINNGVDTNVFKPVDTTEIIKKYGLTGKKVVLAMANQMNRRKGVEYLLKIPNYLDDNEVLVMVGLTKEALPTLPPQKCIGILRTTDVNELAALYSMASVFVIPTLEDNFPTTNIEALSCGTPVITFETGGSIESLDPSVGEIIPKGSMSELVAAVRKFLKGDKVLYTAACRAKAEKLYNKRTQYKLYLSLYNEINKQ